MKFKKGKYYVGDPCYIFEKSWRDVLKETNFFEKEPPQKLYRKRIFVSSTAVGDGSYKDNEGREYYVDSGCIGILPISFIDIDKKIRRTELKRSRGLHMIEFKKDFEVELIEKGIFKFGDIIIDTKNENVEGEVE